MAQGPLLKEFALLACEFRVLPPEGIDEDVKPDEIGEEVSRDAAGESREVDSDDDLPAGYEIELEGVHLLYMPSEEADELVLVVKVALTDPTAPYQLEVWTGSRFTPIEPSAPLEQVATTLLFITYPYLRELVASITARSPYVATTLPPLTRLPHPRVSRGEVDGDEPEEPSDE